MCTYYRYSTPAESHVIHLRAIAHLQSFNTPGESKCTWCACKGLACIDSDFSFAQSSTSKCIYHTGGESGSAWWHSQPVILKSHWGECICARFEIHAMNYVYPSQTLFLTQSRFFIIWKLCLFYLQTGYLIYWRAVLNVLKIYHKTN